MVYRRMRSSAIEADRRAAAEALERARLNPKPFRSWPTTDPDRAGDPDHDRHAPKYEPTETDE
jgi:hypothetical protein